MFWHMFDVFVPPRHVTSDLEDLWFFDFESVWYTKRHMSNPRTNFAYPKFLSVL